jgi:hypothetical protein
LPVLLFWQVRLRRAGLPAYEQVFFGNLATPLFSRIISRGWWGPMALRLRLTADLLLSENLLKSERGKIIP